MNQGLKKPLQRQNVNKVVRRRAVNFAYFGKMYGLEFGLYLFEKK